MKVVISNCATPTPLPHRLTSPSVGIICQYSAERFLTQPRLLCLTYCFTLGAFHNRLVYFWVLFAAHSKLNFFFRTRVNNSQHSLRNRSSMGRLNSSLQNSTQIITHNGPLQVPLEGANNAKALSYRTHNYAHKLAFGLPNKINNFALSYIDSQSAYTCKHFTRE